MRVLRTPLPKKSGMITSVSLWTGVVCVYSSRYTFGHGAGNPVLNVASSWHDAAPLLKSPTKLLLTQEQVTRRASQYRHRSIF
jgi:hypothetical protein